MSGLAFWTHEEGVPGGGTGHGELGAHSPLPACSGSRQRWEVGLEANTGSGWAGTGVSVPRKVVCGRPGGILRERINKTRCTR